MESKYLVFFVLIIVQTTQAAMGDSETMEEKIDSSNCISSLILARSENNENLKTKAFEYIRQNYEKISSSPEFLDLDYSEIFEILNSEIAVTSETIVFNSVKKWINHDSASRKKYLDELSNFMKFEYLPKNILLYESHDFCSENSSRQCHAKILNALQQKEKNNFESADNSFRNTYSTLMVVGSFLLRNSKTFEIFDLRNEKWIKIGNFECDRTDYSAVFLEDKVMLIGGSNENERAVNTVQSYDLNTGAMENLPPMKYARKQLSAVEFKGRVYAIGGYSYNKAPLPYIEMWDPVLNIWKELAAMPFSRTGFRVVVLDGEILVVGGYNGEYLSDLESYDPVTNKWSKRASMNKKRGYPGVAVIGNYLYAVSGFSFSGNNNNTEKYDPEIDKWTMIHSLNEARTEMAAANLFGKLVIIGGWNRNGDYLSSMEMYDDENNKWISMPSLNVPRVYFNAVKIPWRLANATLSREIPK